MDQCVNNGQSQVVSKPTAEHIQIYSYVSQQVERLSFDPSHFIQAIPDQTVSSLNLYKVEQKWMHLVSWC